MSTSNQISLLNDAGSATGNTIKLFATASDSIASAVPGLGAVIAIADFVLQLLGNQADPIQTALDELQQEINQDFQQLNANLAANEIIDRVTNLRDQIAPAESVFADVTSGKLLNLLKAGQLSPSDVDDYIGKCKTALNALSYSLGPWTIVYGDQVYWTDSGIYSYYALGWADGSGRGNKGTTDAGYGTEAPNVQGQNIVFNYTYILPAYLKAVLMFLAVAGSLDPNFAVATEYGNVLTGSAAGPGAIADLTTIYNKIVNEGITQISPAWNNGQTLAGLLANERDGGFPVKGITPLPQGYWQGQSRNNPPSVGANIEYGAIELFSGASKMADYQVSFDSIPSNSTDPAPYRKYQIRLRRKAKELYAALHLGELWRLINSLNNLVGGPLMSKPNFGDWSFRHELIPLAGITPRPDGKIHLADLARFLVYTPPNDTPSLSTLFMIPLKQALSPPTVSRLG